jgi:hypothetical protein
MNNNDLQSMGIGRAVIWRLCVALVIEDLKECCNSFSISLLGDVHITCSQIGELSSCYLSHVISRSA